MDYDKIVKAAGFNGSQADFIARKLESRQVPKNKLNQLHGYFPRVVVLAGTELNQLGNALYDAAVELDKPKRKPKTKRQKTAVEDGK